MGLKCPPSGPQRPAKRWALVPGQSWGSPRKNGWNHCNNRCATGEKTTVFAHLAHALRPALAFFRLLPGLQGFAFLLDGFATLLTFQDHIGIDRLLVAHFT